jgi:3-deoxy-D-manno-octulosonic-acid transferase
MFHFEEISAMALERGAARQVHDVDGLVAAVALYFEQPDLRRAAGDAAYTLVADNRGALGRTLALVEDALRLAGSAAAATTNGAGSVGALAASPRD